MRILLVAYNNLLQTGGDEQQARGLLKALVSQGHSVGCLTLAPPEQVVERQDKLESLGLFELGCIAIPHQESSYSSWAKVQFWFQGHPDQFLAQQTPQLWHTFSRTLSCLCQDWQIEVIHGLGIRTAYFLPTSPPAPVILDLVDSITQHKRREIGFLWERERHWSQLFMAAFDFLKTRRLEQAVLSRFEKLAPVATVSDSDGKIFKTLCPRAEVVTVCHPVAIEPSAETPTPVTRPLIGFYGVMSLRWNVDALKFLIEDILPHVRDRYPDLQFKVTGIHLGHWFELNTQYDWIQVQATVENIRDFIAPLALTCWPFRCGSGVKNKVLESMAMAKPVVTTLLTVEPFTDVQKQGILTGDRPEELADHICYLLANPQEQVRLGQINRQIIQAEFSWERKAENYLQLYQRAQQKYQSS